MAFRVNSIVCVMRDWLYSIAADSLSAFRRSVTCQRQKYSKDIIGPVAYYTEVNSFATTLPVRSFLLRKQMLNFCRSEPTNFAG